jgi:citrate synthase
LLRLAALSAAGVSDADPSLPAHELIGRAWSNDPAAPDLIRRALVLCADHELNASAYTARVAASAEASLPAVLLAGMAALSGNRHGGLTSACRDWVVAMKGKLPPEWRAQHALDGKPAPGFGHLLYPDGDPRAEEVLRLVPEMPEWHGLARLVTAETGDHPTIDFGLALLERVLGLPEGAGMGIFAVGRMAGWTAHVFEQRQTGQLIRPRAAVEA